MFDGTQTSVIVPVLNGEQYLRDAVLSVVDQIGPQDEILVVDDGSTDRTRSMLHGCDSRVTALDGGGRGPAAARNVGLARARGHFIAFLDHDDLWPAGRHRALMTAIIDDKSVNAASGRIRIKVEDGGSAADYLALDGRHTPSILMTCLYRRDLIDRCGMFDEDMRYGEDLDYYLRLADTGMKLVKCEQDSLVYRRHAHNATNSAPSRNTILMEILARRLARARATDSSASPGTVSNSPPDLRAPPADDI